MCDIPKGQVAWLTRNLPVWTSRVDLVKHFARRFRRARLRGEPTTKAFRKACYRHALAVLAAEKQLCRDFRL